MTEPAASGVPARGGRGRARASRAARRRRTLSVLAALVVTVIVLVTMGGSGQSHPKTTGAPGATASTAPPHGTAAPAIEAGVLPWSLDAASSRQVVLSGPGQTLDILGGLSSSNVSLDRVFSLDTATGHIDNLGTLAAGV